MGTPDFAVEALKRIYEDGHNVSLVITQPDKQRGRGMAFTPSPVKAYALEKGLKVYQPQSPSLPFFAAMSRRNWYLDSSCHT